jgi:hypothetical protein
MTMNSRPLSTATLSWDIVVGGSEALGSGWDRLWLGQALAGTDETYPSAWHPFRMSVYYRGTLRPSLIGPGLFRLSPISVCHPSPCHPSPNEHTENPVLRELRLSGRKATVRIADYAAR